MSTITLTVKRQATFPKELCEELQIRPGDRLRVERRMIEGELVWVLRPEKPDWSWIGSVSQAAQGKSHDWDDIRTSIERGWSGEERK